MPIVRVELFEGRTREQKAKAAKEITEVVARALGASPESTHVIFADVSKSDWANAGKLADEK
jgi:4-oxalocrotonate tautomerase